MAAPNIVNVATITGKTTFGTLSTTVSTSLLSNANASGKVFKINSIIVSNSDTSNRTTTISINNGAAGGGATTIKFAHEIPVPTNSTIVIVGKDNPIYLEENTSIVGGAGANTALDYIISYEEIS